MITLPIKKKWFDMISSGEKREEYRDLTPHYKSLFYKYLRTPVRVRFRNGYRLDSPSIERTVIPRIGTGRPEWGAEPGKHYFVLAIQEERDGS
nr:MAG TPA: ASCH domain protein [Caudoviricetes sp.]